MPERSIGQDGAQLALSCKLARAILTGAQMFFKADSTREDIALQLWLVDREFVVSVHNRLRLTRLTVFEYAGHENGAVNSPLLEPSGRNKVTASSPPPSPPVEERERIRPSLSLNSRSWSLDKSAIATLTFALDEWFASNHRGSETTRGKALPSPSRPPARPAMT